MVWSKTSIGAFVLFMDGVADFESFLSRIQSPALLALARHWGAARGKKPMPSWEDLSLLPPAPYAKLLWCFDYEPGSGLFTGRAAAVKFRKWVGETFSGRRLDELYAPANFQESQKVLSRVVTGPLVSRCNGRLFSVNDYVVTGERIAFPVAEDGRIADGVLGASAYAPPPLLGPFKMFHENMEWYGI